MKIAELNLTIEAEMGLTRVEEDFFQTMMENLAIDTKFLVYGRLNGSTDRFKIEVKTSVQGD